LTICDNGAMATRENIVAFLLKRGPANGRQIAAHLGISRQAANKAMQALMLQSRVLKSGETRGASYRLAGKKTDKAAFSRRYPLKGLREDMVFQDSDLALGLRGRVARNVYEIISYATSEMVNNAIDHSGSGECHFAAEVDQAKFRFVVRDRGIGLFRSIVDKFGLDSETQAVGELLKGKTTTMPQRHSGEGIFFTSKAADRAAFRSHSLCLIADNIVKDVFLEKRKFLSGTEVLFEISTHSPRKISRVFARYAPEDYGYKFQRTSVNVKLFGSEYVSRSEAKRLMTGLDKYREIVLDFKDVRSVGQGFADEVFRVFGSRYPGSAVTTENANKAVAAMIKHVVDNRNI